MIGLVGAGQVSAESAHKVRRGANDLNRRYYSDLSPAKVAKTVERFPVNLTKGGLDMNATRYTEK
jgi:hypothetical protein